MAATSTERSTTGAPVLARSDTAPPPTSATARAVALVAERKPKAEALGRRLADLINDPDAFAAALNQGFVELADPEYLDGQRRVAPGIGRLFGVRWPLNAAVDRGFGAATRHSPTTGFLEVAARLFAEPELEPRWFAFGLLDRLLVDDTERAWQLLRRAAREAGDWITVDSLAHPIGHGIILEPYRWAELDSLVFSPSRWERRLVGSTVATLPYVDHRRGRTSDVTRHGLALVDDLIGDDQPDVQKALAWALRSMAMVDPVVTLAFVERQAELAAASGDGHRAWVLRDTLAKLPPTAAAGVRDRLQGIRRRSGDPSTSRAASTAARFSGDAGLPLPSHHRDRFPDSAARPGDARQ